MIGFLTLFESPYYADYINSLNEEDPFFPFFSNHVNSFLDFAKAAAEKRKLDYAEKVASNFKEENLQVAIKKLIIGDYDTTTVKSVKIQIEYESESEETEEETEEVEEEWTEWNNGQEEGEVKEEFKNQEEVKEEWNNGQEEGEVKEEFKNQEEVKEEFKNQEEVKEEWNNQEEVKEEWNNQEESSNLIDLPESISTTKKSSWFF